MMKQFVLILILSLAPFSTIKHSNLNEFLADHQLIIKANFQVTERAEIFGLIPIFLTVSAPNVVEKSVPMFFAGTMQNFFQTETNVACTRQKLKLRGIVGKENHYTV